MITQTPYQGTIVTLWQSEINNITHLVNHYGFKFAIELGTYKGGSALVLVNAGIEDLYTYDNRDIAEVKDSRVTYRVSDIFKPETTEEIKQLCKLNKPKLFFCDNGKKTLEINTFGPFLNTGDVLVAHDYPIEFKDSDVSAMIDGNGYERLLLPHNDRIIAWRKK